MQNKPFRFNQDDVQSLESSTLFDGFFRLIKTRFRHRLYAGGWSGIVEREILVRGDAVAVLPYDPVRQQVVLIEQIRIGATGREASPWLLECIAGIIDEGESPETVCRREAEEEAGLHLGALHKALSYYSSPGGSTERLYVYLACVDASMAADYGGLEHEGEDIAVFRLGLDDAFALLEQGKIDNAATVIALQYLMLNRQKLEQIFQPQG